jgi:hypothetical protein
MATRRSPATARRVDAPKRPLRSAQPCFACERASHYQVVSIKVSGPRSHVPTDGIARQSKAVRTRALEPGVTLAVNMLLLAQSLNVVIAFND